MALLNKGKYYMVADYHWAKGFNVTDFQLRIYKDKATRDADYMEVEEVRDINFSGAFDTIKIYEQLKLLKEFATATDI